jgi:hypothetical protein
MNAKFENGFLVFDPKNLATSVAYYTVTITRNTTTVVTATRVNRDITFAIRATPDQHFGYVIVLKDSSDATVDTITKGV